MRKKKKKQPLMGTWEFECKKAKADMMDMMPTIIHQVKLQLEARYLGKSIVVLSNPIHIGQVFPVCDLTYLVTRRALQENKKAQKYFEFDDNKMKWKGISTKSFMLERLYCAACLSTATLAFFSLEETFDSIVQVARVRKPNSELETVATKCYEQQFRDQYTEYSGFFDRPVRKKYKLT